MYSKEYIMKRSVFRRISPVLVVIGFSLMGGWLFNDFWLC